MLNGPLGLSCTECAAKSMLQTLQGCHTPAKKPLKILDYEYLRCPLQYVRTASFRLYRMHQDGLLTASFETKRRSPAKRMQAVQFIDSLLKVKPDDDRT